MKKFITFILCLFGLLAMAQDDNSNRFPLWLQELQSRNVGMIDSVVGYPADAAAPEQGKCCATDNSI